MQPLRDCGLWLFDLAGYMYDAPASFKSWLEHAVQIGLTVDEEWKPLLSGKRVVVISAWGGSEDEVSPELGFASALRKAMKFIGVEDITFLTFSIPKKSPPPRTMPSGLSADIFRICNYKNRLLY